MESFIYYVPLMMNMSIPIKLDHYDKELLYQLDHNARQSYVQLAKKVGLSKDAIKYRMNNYLKTGLLDGFYTLIDTPKLGYYSLRVYFNFRNTTTKKEEEIIQYLIKQKQVWWFARTEGACHIAFGFWGKTLSEFHEFWKEFKKIYAVYVINEKQGIFMELHHFDRNYLTKKNKSFSINSVGEPYTLEIDPINEQILRLLSVDARISIVDICKKIKLTPKAVILRIKSLEKKKIILAYKPKLNLEKIGYAMYKVDVSVSDQTKIKNLKEYVYQLPNIVHYETVFGGSDFEFDVEVPNFEKFMEIISSIKQKYGDSISAISYFWTLKNYKTVYLP